MVLEALALHLNQTFTQLNFHERKDLNGAKFLQTVGYQDFQLTLTVEDDLISLLIIHSTKAQDKYQVKNFNLNEPTVTDELDAAIRTLLVGNVQ